MRPYWYCCLMILLGVPPAIAELALSIPNPEKTTAEVEIAWTTADGSLAPETGKDLSGSLNVATPWSGQVKLDQSKSWTIRARVDGFWSSSFLWPSEKAGSFQVEWLPAAHLKATLRGEVQHGSAATASLADFRVWINRTVLDGKIRPEWEPVECELDDFTLECEIPRGNLDLKISATDYVPEYRWGLKIDADGLSLGDVHLRQGASVSGWAVAIDAGEDSKPIEARLVPRTIGWQENLSEHLRSQMKSLKVEVNEDGFFTMGPVPPGGFDLEVSKMGWAPQYVEDLDLTGRKEVVLDEVIELFQPPGLDIYIAPPVSPKQQPWEVVLMRPRSNSGTFKTVHRSGASFAGHWHLDSVPSGDYRIEIRDHQGATWLVREQELVQVRDAVFLELDSMAVQGTLTLGGEAIQGVVVFGTRQGRPNVALTAQDGVFEGVLPREGEWAVEVELARSEGDYSVRTEPIVIERPVSGSAASVDIELPDTRLEGEVRLGEDLVPDAFVLIRGPLEEKVSSVARTRTDADGRFGLSGLNPSSLEVSAYLGAFDPASDWVRVDLKEDIAAPYLELVLFERSEFQALVISAHGPIAGAQVFVESGDPQTGTLWPAQAISETDGVARFRLPASSRSNALLLTVAAGYGTTFQRMTLGAEAIPISLSPEKGDLVLMNVSGTLYFNGFSVPVSSLMNKMIAIGRVRPNPEGGLVFRDMAAGEYAQCLGFGSSEDCDKGILANSGNLTLRAFSAEAASGVN